MQYAIVLRVFGISTSFHVKQDTATGVQFLFFWGFLRVLEEFSFRSVGGGAWHWTIIP